VRSNLEDIVMQSRTLSMTCIHCRLQDSENMKSISQLLATYRWEVISQR